MNDLKFAFRQLLKNPGFTAVANTIFSVINAYEQETIPTGRA